MSTDSKLSFAAPSASKAELEEGAAFTPRFDEHGLIGAIVTDEDGGDVLMFAFMNAEALRLTIETGEAHFYSRSRKSLWKKGETSGNVLRVRELLTDCDQDVLWVKVELQGEAACHTGRRSCFYRRIEAGTDGVALELVTK
ncbi:phosphoribosyl-AMP cyclohydrolase [Rhodomicrobium sp. Az07]|uniref:phosphoribosyl-AMP cyclohydrolase n=1 Tax=Rhodomicrobium sp. Az07 TaxID=2839034 RepID=UPI001BE68559|nr:phosphoribosyl-AMP cyclohydrolase [Rhodomicrobium sp. Az07]MBT3070585.1 phosphoribosyl-AMP cyclohydrolase [Rhodomicrobium sp. Az07]